jgi:hypothetical protein
VPLTAFKCPDSITRPISLCLDHCPRQEGDCLAMAIRIGASNQREWNGKASVTQLLKGTREAYLQIVCDYAADPDDMAFMIYGSMQHRRLEIINKRLEGLTEHAFSQEISGSIDRLEPDVLNKGYYRLIDFKFTGAYSLTVDKHDWELQLNRYRLLIESTPEIKDLFPISKMYIQAIIRDSGLRQMESLGLTKRMPLIEMPKLDDMDTYYYFHDKEALLQEALRTKTMPPLCSYEERWNNRKCLKYCLVKEKCPEGSKMR